MSNKFINQFELPLNKPKHHMYNLIIGRNIHTLSSAQWANVFRKNKPRPSSAAATVAAITSIVNINIFLRNCFVKIFILYTHATKHMLRPATSSPVRSVRPPQQVRLFNKRCYLWSSNYAQTPDETPRSMGVWRSAVPQIPQIVELR